MNNQAKPDDRSDNAMRIKENIRNTKENIKAAEKMIDITYDDKTKADLAAKNERRRNAIPDMKREMREEKDFQKRS